MFPRPTVTPRHRAQSRQPPPRLATLRLQTQGAILRGNSRGIFDMDQAVRFFTVHPRFHLERTPAPPREPRHSARVCLQSNWSLFDKFDLGQLIYISLPLRLDADWPALPLRGDRPDTNKARPPNVVRAPMTLPNRQGLVVSPAAFPPVRSAGWPCNPTEHACPPRKKDRQDDRYRHRPG